jgi:MYXO-CTERM domain-containing protein
MVVGLGMTAVGERNAAACGGVFENPNEIEDVITDHRMILSISPQQTTLYDEIEFTGKASSFAWVLPIKGTATIGLSADLVFSTLDTLTQAQVVTPPTNCPPPPSCGDSEFDGPEASGAGFAADAGTLSGSTVTVTEQQQVGPYETVQLHSSDPNALTNWLTSHGYSMPSGASSVVSAYIAEGFDFLAMKLAPGQGVTAMRPVRVTTPGASPVLPLRMVSVGTGATTGVTLWVVADGRYEPQNFPFFQLSNAQLAWDWETNTSDYDQVRLQKEAALNGQGWQVESSLDLSQYTIINTVQAGGTQGAFGTQSADGVYLPVGDAGADDGGPETPDQARQADLSTLFAGINAPNARVTRLRSDLAHAALGTDLQLQASSDQSEVSNIYNPAQQIGEPICPVYNGSCEQVGTAPLSQATAMAAINNKTVGNGCSTATHGPNASSGTALASLLGLLGFVAVRSRRRRAP